MRVFKLRGVLLVASLCVAVLVMLVSTEKVTSLVGGAVMFTGIDVDAPVVLYANEEGYFFGDLSINGKTLKYIVDSGASNITLNSSDASKANIDYTKGELVNLTTPGGNVNAFSLKLEELMIGSIILDDMNITVVEGTSPPYVLLGISAQNRLDLKRDNAVMTLGRKH